MVGKSTLDRTIGALNISGVPDAPPTREQQRFGNHSEVHHTACSIKFLIKVVEESSSQTHEFDISFEVVEGELPFLISLSSLLVMRATINFRFK